MDSQTTNQEVLEFLNTIIPIVVCDCFKVTVAKRVTHLSRNSEDVGLKPGTGRYIVAWMTT